MFESVIQVFSQIGVWIVVLAVGVSFIFLAIGVARGSIEAQWANQLGSAVGLNQAYTRIVMTVLLAALGLSVPVVITTIANGLTEAAGTITVEIPQIEINVAGQ